MISEWLAIIENWLIDYGVLGLLIVSFTDSAFSPIIPEMMLIPMGIASPDKVWLYAFYTTVASVLGALLGWYIGKKLGRPVLLRFIKEDKINKVEYYFERYGAMAILIAAFTPVPYKVFTIFSGISKVKIRTLVFWSILGRGGRFFLEAAIIAALGVRAKPFIEENFAIITLGIGGIAVVAFIVYRLILSRKKTANS
ncbi:membrane phosphatase [Bacillus freudenreichii]|nr:membrane phosphatase [Bacillus freudenreichii]